MSFMRGIVSTIAPYNLWHTFQEESPNAMASTTSTSLESSHDGSQSGTGSPNFSEINVTESYQGIDESSELERLRESEKRNLLQVAALEAKLQWATSSKRRKKASTDRERGKKPSDLNGQDAVNYNAYMPAFVEVLHHNKILPQGWHEYTVDERTLCARLMSRVTVPYGFTAKEYYEEMMAPQITNKIRIVKCNYLMHLRGLVQGELSFMTWSVR